MALTLEQQRELERLEAEQKQLEELLKQLPPEDAYDAFSSRNAQSYGAGTRFDLPRGGYQSRSGPVPRAAQEALIEGAGSTVGAAVGALPMFSIPTGGLSIPLGSALFGAGANAINQMRRGEPGQPAQPVRIGEMLGTGVASLLPAGRVAGTGVAALGREAAKQAAGNIAAAATETAIDEGRLPTLGEAALAGGAGAAGAVAYRGAARETKALAEETRKAQRTYRDQLMRTAQEVGFLFDPVKSNPTLATRGPSKAGYPAEFYREAAESNQEVTNRLVRREIGLPDDADLGNPMTLASEVVKAKQPYSQVASLSPVAKNALERWQMARQEARDYWQDYSRNAGVKEKKAAIAAEQRVAIAERVLEREARKAGKPDLILGLQEAKVKLAKLHQVELAMHKTTGDIDAKVLARVYDSNPKMFTGNLKLIAEVAHIQPYMFRDASDLRGALTDIGGVAGFGGVYDATVGEGLRKLQMSKPFQKSLAVPRYNTSVQDPVGTFLMRGTQSLGR